jgi:hypothetical protein
VPEGEATAGDSDTNGNAPASNGGAGSASHATQSAGD